MLPHHIKYEYQISNMKQAIDLITAELRYCQLTMPKCKKRKQKIKIKQILQSHHANVSQWK